MTIAMKLKEEGIKEGEIKGKIEGKIEGKQNALIKQMNKKFNLTQSETELIKSVNDMEKLDLAIEEILFAKDKEDILKIFK